MSEPIPVLHVVDTLGLGGAERFLVGLVTHLDTTRFRPLVAWVSAPGPFADDLQRAGIPVVGLHARGHRDVRAWQRLVRLMREEQIRIVHTHLFVDGFYGRLAALWSKVPARIVTQQNAYDDPTRRLPRWQIWTNRALVPITQQFVAVSSVAAEYLQKVEWVPRSKIRVIPNAIEIPPPVPEEDVRALRRAWAARDGQGPLIGTVARLEPQKGLDVLIRAVALIRQDVPDVRCVIVGQGALREPLERLAETLGVRDRVIFAGTRRDIPAVLAALDVFVLPSRFEGLSLALLEALAAARPVVATAVSGTVDVIQPGENGLLVPTEDPAALAHAVVQLLKQPHVARMLGEQGQKSVRSRYTIDRVAHQYMELYGTLDKRTRPANTTQ
ncbi:MAG: glycosyltransferase [Chloroflexi bacterium]|nr:glycosyltransferase [Chloroflexota bacterium]